MSKSRPDIVRTPLADVALPISASLRASRTFPLWSILKPGGRKTVAHGASRGSEVPEYSPGTGRKNSVGREAFRPVPGLSDRSPESQGLRLGLLSFALRACQVSVTLAPVETYPVLQWYWPLGLFGAIAARLELQFSALPRRQSFRG